MLNNRLFRLCAVVIIVVMMLPTSMAQAGSGHLNNQSNCPPYDPRMGDDLAFLSQLSPECRSAYHKIGSPEGQSSSGMPTPQFTGGPDGYGYTWDDSLTPSWIDTSAGTNTGLSDWGGVTGPISLPFTFRYYDNEYTSLYITSFGYIALEDSPYWWDQDYLPYPDQPNTVIAPYWTPTYIPVGAWVHYMSGGTAPNRYFVVEWHNLTGGYSGDPIGNNDSYLFEVILHENGNIDFQYSSMVVNSNWWCGVAGIENSTGLDGLAYVDFCDIPPSFLAVRFFRPATGSFIDVTTSYWASQYIERLYNAGITGGCATSPLKYCPENQVTRAQMAVFLLKGIHGSSYNPPPVGAGTGFADVPTSYWAAPWIKQLAAEGVTGGCGGGNFCPDNPVTRAQMAVFLLKSKHGVAYTPPAATGVFADVPVGYWADKWIEQLATEAITGGCGGSNYCPDNPVTRAQMAVFLVKTFNLP